MKFKRISHLYLAVALALSLSFGGLLGGGLLLAYYHSSNQLGQLAKLAKRDRASVVLSGILGPDHDRERFGRDPFGGGHERERRV